MRKVTTINLHDNAYQVDEEGYDALRAYLDNAERALADNPDRAEILLDLELAIADRCAATLGPHKTVVSTQEIEQILKDMGPVAGAAPGAGADAASASGGDSSQTRGDPSAPRPRRLYRLREDQKLAGVCAGLAAYAGIDVTWVRVAFILLTVFSAGFGLVAYVALVFVMPIAETAEQVAAAHGAPFSAQDLVDRVKKKTTEPRSDGRHRARMSRSHGRWHATGPAPGGGARLAGGLLLPVLTVMSAAWFAAMAVAAFSIWWLYDSRVLFSWQQHHWGGWNGLPMWVALSLLLVAYAVIAIPIGAARRAALYYANGGRLHGWADAWSGLLWLALVAATLLTAWALLPYWQGYLQQLGSHGHMVLHL